MPRALFGYMALPCYNFYMIDPELKEYLAGIKASLVDIKNKKHPGIWRAFFNGIFSALGYFVGLALIILIIGWFLNKTGFLPQFQKQIQDFQSFMDQARKVMTAGDSSQQNVNEQGSIITLPDGRKIQVVQ